MLITVYDLRHKIIPDLFHILFAFVTFVGIIFRIGNTDKRQLEIFQVLDFNCHTLKYHIYSRVLYFVFPIPYFLWLFQEDGWVLGDANFVLGIGWFWV